VSTGWAAAVFLLISEASIFAYLFFAILFFGAARLSLAAGQSADFHLVGTANGDRPDRRSGVLVGQSLGQPRSNGESDDCLAITIALATASIVLQFIDWFNEPFSLASSPYGSNYFVISGFHLAHFVGGWLMFLVLPLWTWLGYFDAVRHVPITISALS
jgi:cytochrome c oxidase subunit III